MIRNKRENSVAYNYIGIECGYRGTMHLWYVKKKCYFNR